jgi:hypothetical protein
MSDTPQLPALSTLDKAGLQKAYAAELGKDADDALTVVDLREALTDHRATAAAVQSQPLASGAAIDPTQAPDGVGPVPAGHIRVVHNETRLPHDLPQTVWDNLGPEQENYTVQGEKPTPLKA